MEFLCLRQKAVDVGAITSQVVVSNAFASEVTLYGFIGVGIHLLKESFQARIHTMTIWEKTCKVIKTHDILSKIIIKRMQGESSDVVCNCFGQEQFAGKYFLNVRNPDVGTIIVENRIG
jgi:hypothetical protein